MARRTGGSGCFQDRQVVYGKFPCLLIESAPYELRDVHLSDLMSGRETLADVDMIVFCGGFSNSDVLGSAKGWAAGFLWNENANKALHNFYSRPDTLSLGVCNGCQLMVELNLIDGIDAPRSMRMEHNSSGKFESAFLTVEIPANNSVMLSSLAGAKAGIWVAHGEGRFVSTDAARKPNVALKYLYNSYPGNPNGSEGAIAGICSADGRHLAMMPHLERAVFPWQWAWGGDKAGSDATLWLQAFVNGRRWLEERKK